MLVSADIAWEISIKVALGQTDGAGRSAVVSARGSSIWRSRIFITTGLHESGVPLRDARGAVRSGVKRQGLSWRFFFAHAEQRGVKQCTRADHSRAPL